MKILHITTHLTGGAAMATLRIHRALVDCDEESLVLTLDDKGNDKRIIKFKPTFDFRKPIGVTTIIKSLLYKFNMGMGHYWRMHDEARKHGECHYTYPVSPYRVEQHPLVKWADIIHLHFCDDFINYPTFFKMVKKPIVWTLHDIGIGYGGFHYKNDQKRLLPFFNEIEYEFVEIKKKALNQSSNLNIVSLSKEMFDFCHRIDYLKNKTNYIIPNGVDTTQFILFDKNVCRNELHLPTEKIILLFVAEYVQTQSKGLDLLKESIKTYDKDNMLICIVGNYPKDMPQKDIVNTRYFGKVQDVNTLSKIYSSADYFVMPSSQEVCPQAPLEAMACGTPVVVFPTGAMKDYVLPQYGVVCKDCSLEALVDGIKEALNKSYDSHQLREYVTANFSPSKIARKYIELYKSVIKNI